MTANIQLGNLCARAGKKLELNPAGEITNDPAINELAWREPRGSWGPLEKKIWTRLVHQIQAFRKIS